MPRIPLRDVKPGQSLAKPITNANGVVLVQAGTPLTAILLARLESMGVDGVYVSLMEGAAEMKPLAEALAELDARFAGHEDDAWMMALRDIVLGQLRAKYEAHG